MMEVMDEDEAEPVDESGASATRIGARDLEEKPEADALEQAQPVETDKVRIVSRGREDVPEADWLEQSLVEPLDEDEPR